MGKKVIFLAKNKEFPFRVFRGSSSGEYPISNVSNFATCDSSSPHVLDDIVAEFRTFDFGGPFHQPGEIVGHPLGGDGTVESFDD